MKKIVVGAATVAILSVLIAAPVAAHASSGNHAAEMERQVSLAASGAASDGSPDRETFAIGGVAKALNAGFKAAGAYKAAAQVAGWASIIGSAGSTGELSADAEAAYFDR